MAEALPEQDMVFEKANEIFKKEINAKVNFVPIAPSDYEQKMQTRYASGDAGDINFTSSWTNKAGYEQLSLSFDGGYAVCGCGRAL